MFQVKEATSNLVWPLSLYDLPWRFCWAKLVWRSRSSLLPGASPD